MYIQRRNSKDIFNESLNLLEGVAIADISLNTPENNQDERIFYITEDITIQNIIEIIQQINSINKYDDLQEKYFNIEGHVYNRKPITIYVSSFGGSVYDGLSLVGIIQSSKTPIHTIATGKVMSMGFIIALVGHKRFCTKYTTFMVHSVSSFIWGTTKHMEEDLAESKRVQRILYDIIINKSKIYQSTLDNLTTKKIDWYFDEEQALKMNVVDEIL